MKHEQNIEYLFEHTLTLPPGERESWLKEKCKNDHETVEVVLKLVKLSENTDGFFSRPAAEKISIPLPDFSGQTIGAYKIKHVIGKGGMGRVYLAHRNDGEFKKKVAIKFVDALHMDNEILKRERQILADLEISHVVTLLDGGTTEAGFPYIVMEYVDGVPVNEYIQKQNVSRRECLQLIRDLATVVHMANNRGIIHCDLKPCNVLVTWDGALKLLDFGIARLTNTGEQNSLDNTLTKVLTPEYASPQRSKNQIPAITDDVYSLGIILAELITRQAPELIHSAATDARRTDTARFAGQIDDFELRTIYTKATAHDPEQRYPSAKALALDLQRKLDGEAISALYQAPVYRVKKFLINHKGFVTSSLLTLLLLMSAPIIAMNYVQMKKNTEQTEAFISDLIRDIDKEFDSYNNSSHLRMTQLRYAIEKAETYQDNIMIRTKLAELYAKLGKVAGHPYGITLGNLAESKRYYGNAIELYAALLEKRNSIEAYEEYNEARRRMAEITGYEGKVTAAITQMRQIRHAMDNAYEMFGIPHKKRYYTGLFAMVEAFGHLHQKNFREAARLLDIAKTYFDFARNRKDPEHIDRIVFYNELRGDLALLQKQNPRKALTFFRKVMNLTEKAKTPSWKMLSSLGRIHQFQGCHYLENENPAAALQAFKKSKNIYHRLHKRYPDDPRILKRHEDFHSINDQQTPVNSRQLWAQMNCNNPLQFMIPPKTSG